MTTDVSFKEVLETIWDTELVAELFQKGLATANDRLAVPAMEELLCRGKAKTATRILNQAFKKGQIKEGSVVASRIFRYLYYNTGPVDDALREYGKEMWQKRSAFVGPYEWVRENKSRFLQHEQSGPFYVSQPKVPEWVKEQIKEG